MAGLIYDVLSNDYEATSPNCGGNNGEIVTAVAAPLTAKCDGQTTNTATSGIGGGGSSYVTSVAVTTSTDNTLLIDLLGSPRTGSVCSNRQGGTWCWDQDYKAATPNQYTGKSGNIDWNYSIFCGVKQNPDISGTVPEKISCP